MCQYRGEGSHCGGPPIVIFGVCTVDMLRREEPKGPPFKGCVLILFLKRLQALLYWNMRTPDEKEKRTYSVNERGLLSRSTPGTCG